MWTRRPGKRWALSESDFDFRAPDAEFSIIQYSASQAAVAFHDFLGAFLAAGFVHPVAGSALFGGLEADAVEGESFADEAVEVDPADDHVASESTGRKIRVFGVDADLVDHRKIDESDLALVGFFPIEEAVAQNSFSCDQFDFLMLGDGVVFRALAVSSEVIVAFRGEQMVDTDFLHVRRGKR